MLDKKLKFIVFTEYGEILDLAIHLSKVEGHEVKVFIDSRDYKNVGEGIVEKEKEWFKLLGQDYTWCIDSCDYGEFQDWLRSKGEAVFGGSKQGDKLENDRQLGQKWFVSAGFKQPFSKNFKDIEEAIKFVTENKQKRWILKQNADAPKSINHMGKFEGSEDMLFHLDELKKKWNEPEFGKFDCDLMEIVEGLEIAASVFFNGKDYMKNSQGKVVGYLNFEEKKEADGGLGEVCGEMGTTFMGVTEDDPVFKEILIRTKILEVLRASKFRGVFDINCIKTKGGMVALEPTCRFGVPGGSYEFIEGLGMNTGELLYSVARGLDVPVEVKQTVGMVMVIAAKPFPVEANVEPEGTSIGEKLWILERGKPNKDLTPEQWKHIHLYNFKKDDDNYLVATKNGYLLTVTGAGKNIPQVRENLIQYIKDNIYIPGMKYRHDIGKRVEDYYKK